MLQNKGRDSRWLARKLVDRHCQNYKKHTHNVLIKPNVSETAHYNATSAGVVRAEEPDARLHITMSCPQVLSELKSQLQLHYNVNYNYKYSAVDLKSQWQSHYNVTPAGVVRAEEPDWRWLDFSRRLTSFAPGTPGGCPGWRVVGPAAAALAKWRWVERSHTRDAWTRALM